MVWEDGGGNPASYPIVRAVRYLDNLLAQPGEVLNPRKRLTNRRCVSVFVSEIGSDAVAIDTIGKQRADRLDIIRIDTR